MKKLCFQEKLFNFCFNKKNTIILKNRDENDSFLPITMLASTPLNLFAMNTNNTFQKQQRFHRNFEINETHVRQRMNSVTSVGVFISSTELLGAILKGLKNSVWWNHEALFLIINGNENGCQMARLFLSTLWNFNILWVTYLCRKRNNQLLLYTFNPYTSLAPIFWKKVQDNHFSNEHWTLLEHPLEESLSYREYMVEKKFNSWKIIWFLEIDVYEKKNYTFANY